MKDKTGWGNPFPADTSIDGMTSSGQAFFSQSQRRVQRALFFVLAGGCLLLAGCGHENWDDVTPVVIAGTKPELISAVPKQPTLRVQPVTPMVEISADPVTTGDGITVLNIGDALQEHRLSPGDELPTKEIPDSTLQNVPVKIALQAVLASTDITVVSNETLDDRLVTLEHAQGMMSDIVNDVCAQAGLFCAYRHGVLEVHRTETFIVTLPGTGSDDHAPVAALAQVVGTMLDTTAGDKLHLDADGNSFIYTTGLETQHKIHTLFDRLHQGIPLITEQVFVWRLKLDGSHRRGVAWSDLKPEWQAKPAKSDDGFESMTIGNVPMTHLATFLARQGQLSDLRHDSVSFVAANDTGLPDAQDDTSLVDGLAVSGSFANGSIQSRVRIQLETSRTVLNLTASAPTGQVTILSQLHAWESDDNTALQRAAGARQMIVALRPHVYLFAKPLIVRRAKNVSDFVQAGQKQTTGQALPATPEEWPQAVVIDKGGARQTADKPALKPVPVVRKPAVQTVPVMRSTVPRAPMNPAAPAATIYDKMNAEVLENRHPNRGDEEENP